MTGTATETASRTGRRAWSDLLHRIVKTVQSRGLFERGQHLLVGVSGGPDSVALLSLLHRLRASWRLTLTAVHCNYGLRGSESAGDQEFVEAVCRRLEVPLHTVQLNVERRARGTSLQAAARDLRYRTMTEIAQQCGADRIAVGHTADDQAETLFLWMLRGAGLAGFSGMPACRDDGIVRPLYETRRREILAYLQSEGLSFRQDSSNDKPVYLRNRIRQEIIPALQQLAPSAVEAICRLADLCREDDRYLDAQVAELCESRINRLIDGEQVIDRSFLLEVPRAAQRRVVRMVLQRYSSSNRPPSFRTVERVLQVLAKGDRISDLAIPSARVTVEKDFVRFFPAKPQERSYGQDHQMIPTVLSVPGQVIWAGTGQHICAQRLARKDIHVLAREQDRIVVDADRVSEPLVVRAWKSGDRFCPLGMKGRSKKLQDFFTDLKVSGGDRRRIPVVAAPEGIVWIVGYRQDDRWSATAATERCLVMTVDA